MTDKETASFLPWSTKDNGLVVSFVRIAEASAIFLGAVATGQECIIWPAGISLLLSVATQKAALPDHSPADQPGKHNLHK